MGESQRFNPEKTDESEKMDKLKEEIYKLLHSNLEEINVKKVLLAFNINNSRVSTVDYLVEEIIGDVQEHVVKCDNLEWLNGFLTSFSFRMIVYKNKMIDIFRNESRRPKMSDVSLSGDDLNSDDNEGEVTKDIKFEDINFGRAEAVYDLEYVYNQIKDDQKRNIFKEIVESITNGNTSIEIAKKLVEKGLHEKERSYSTISVFYSTTVKKYLLEHFPDFPLTIDDLQNSLGFYKDKTQKDKIEKDSNKGVKELEQLLDNYYKAKDSSNDKFIDDKINYLEFKLRKGKLGKNFFFQSEKIVNDRYVAEIKKRILIDSGMKEWPRFIGLKNKNQKEQNKK